MKSKLMRSVTSAAFAALAGAGLAAPAIAQESVLRVAMTAADIPDWTGAPDQGYEGYRFAGYTMYDALALWDLSSSDKAADIVPGLATSWEVDPANPLVWTYHLREGVTFHDGCPWNADSAIWNFDRVLNNGMPHFNARHAGMQGSGVVNVAAYEKVDDLTIKIQELRKKAETELGDKFDIKDFHAVVLGSGSVPLDVLADQVDAWIAAGGGAPTT